MITAAAHLSTSAFSMLMGRQGPRVFFSRPSSELPREKEGTVIDLEKRPPCFTNGWGGGKKPGRDSPPLSTISESGKRGEYPKNEKTTKGGRES